MLRRINFVLCLNCIYKIHPVVLSDPPEDFGDASVLSPPLCLTNHKSKFTCRLCRLFDLSAIHARRHHWRRAEKMNHSRNISHHDIQDISMTHKIASGIFFFNQSDNRQRRYH